MARRQESQARKSLLDKCEADLQQRNQQMDTLKYDIEDRESKSLPVEHLVAVREKLSREIPTCQHTYLVDRQAYDDALRSEEARQGCLRPGAGGVRRASYGKWLAISADDIAEIVAQWTGVPVTRLLEAEQTKLLHMEDSLHQRIVGPG